MVVCKNLVKYQVGNKVISLVSYSPDFTIGTVGTIAYRWYGKLYGVRLPNGVIFRWLDSSELETIVLAQHRLDVGDFAVVNTDRHSFKYPFLERGTVVEILKIIETDYYELIVDGKKHETWIADFDIARIE